MNTRKSFGQIITEARELKDLTIEVVSEKAGIEPNTLSRIENGKFNPGLDILLRIGDALDLKLGYDSIQ